MKKSRIGFAGICTASIAIAGFALWGGVNIWQAGRQIPVQNQQNDFSPANAVELAETETITETELPADEYGISVEQDGDIVRLSIPVQENDTLYEVKFGYVPDGLEYREDGPYALKYHNYENENDEHAITPSFCRVADPSEPYTAEYDTVYEVDKFKTSSGNSAVFLKKSRGWDMLFVQFEGTPYIEACFINGFSYEEMHQFADEMYLEETDKEIGSLWKGEPDDSDNFNYDVIFQCEEGSDSMGDYKLAFGWTPEDLNYQTDNIGEGAWNEICIAGENTEDTINTRRSVGYVLYRVEDVSQPFLWPEFDVANATNMETDSGNEAVICTFDSSSAVDARIYVHFKDTPYIAELVTRKLSEKEYLRLVNSLYLTESDEQYYTIYQAQEGTDDSILTGFCNPEQMNRIHVGDSVTADNTSDIQLTVNSATLQKDFTGITTDCTGDKTAENYSKYLDTNGLLIAHRTEYATDENELENEIIREEDIQQYILKLDVTLTRNDENPEKEWYDNGLCFQAGVFSIEDDNSVRCSLYNIGHGTEIIHSPNLNSESFFAFYTPHEHEKNGIYDLQPHESADVTLYYAVDADQIGNLYISLFDGGIVTCSYIDDGCPVLDLCDLTAPE
ncbi:MAG: hypothetical protein IJJ69_08090 [Oscillospiraceae bacterium]|nr:hypothetical protein [Oscillospiraceae bacterium]